MSKKLTYKYVKKIFEAEGCELLGEYVNYDIKVKYRCSCGNISKIFLGNLKKGQKCMKCGTDKASKSLRLKIGEVKNIFRDGGCELLSESYNNFGEKLEYKCSCGNISEISLRNFKSGRRCKKCGYKKIGKAQKYSYEYVKNVFEGNGCILLSKYYDNNMTGMEYICECKNISKISFATFLKGHRCRKCGTKKISGKNSVHYNHNITDEERYIKRHYPEYNQWRTEVYKRDSFTCQCCSQWGGSLNAHHIQNYSSHKDIRLDINNGITLCSECHRSFHSIYGKKNNTSSQLEEFLSEFKSKVLNDDKVIVSV